VLETPLQQVDPGPKAGGGAVKPCFVAKPDGSADFPPLPGIIPASIGKALASHA